MPKVNWRIHCNATVTLSQETKYIHISCKLLAGTGTSFEFSLIPYYLLAKLFCFLHLCQLANRGQYHVAQANDGASVPSLLVSTVAVW